MSAARRTKSKAKWWQTMLAVIVLLVLIRACTGGGRSEPTAPAAPTRTTAVRATTSKVVAPSPTPTTPARLVDVDDRYVPNRDEDDDRNVYVPPPPEPKKRTGNSGHPCLPGERDGDNDGYCGEGR